MYGCIIHPRCKDENSILLLVFFLIFKQNKTKQAIFCKNMHWHLIDKVKNFFMEVQQKLRELWPCKLKCGYNYTYDVRWGLSKIFETLHDNVCRAFHIHSSFIDLGPLSRLWGWGKFEQNDEGCISSPFQCKLSEHLLLFVWRNSLVLVKGLNLVSCLW